MCIKGWPRADHLKGLSVCGDGWHREKIETIKKDLISKGVGEEHLSKLSAPIGLDIGAEIPGAIALSIAGEMISVKRGKGVNPHRVHEKKP